MIINWCKLLGHDWRWRNLYYLVRQPRCNAWGLMCSRCGEVGIALL